MPQVLRWRPLPHLLLAALAVVLTACEQEPAATEGAAGVNLEEEIAAFEDRVGALEDRVGALESVAAEDADQAETLAAEDILDDPSSFAGEQITLASTVGDVVDGNAFTLDAAEPLLVTVPSGTQPPSAGASVEVTGSVRESFSVAEFEQEFGVDLDDEVFAEFEQQPFVVADTVTEPTT